MTAVLLVLLFSVQGAVGARGSEPRFSDVMSDLWLRGHKSEVLDVAKMRLRRNPDDIAGLLLKMEFELAFLHIDELTATMDRLVKVGDQIHTPNFAPQFKLLKISLERAKTIIKQYPAAVLQKERHKGNIAQKPMLVRDAVRAAERDGLVAR